MKKDNKNGFLITWFSCILFLLVLCFFGVNDSVKGTSALDSSNTCPTGYKDCKKNGLSGCECYKSKAAIAVPEKVGGYCTCQAVQTGSGSCTCETAAGTTYAGTCNGSSCNCGSGGSVFSNSCHGATQVVSGTCIKSGSSAFCDCGTNNVNGDHCTFTEASYGCDSGWTQSGSMCYLYAEYETTGDQGDDDGNDNVSEDSSCHYDPTSHLYKDKYGKVCSLNCPDGYSEGKPSNAVSCEPKTTSSGYTCWKCIVDLDCGEGTHEGKDEYGNQVCLPDCECNEGDDCLEEEKEKSFCWDCNGTLYWGLESKYPNCVLSYESKANCTGTNSLKPSSSSSKPSSSSSKPSSSSSIPSSSSSSRPSSSSSSRPSSSSSSIPSSSSSSRPSSSSSSRPSSSSESNNYINRGEGCYQNKDTNEYKWFESDPEIYSQTKLYEKVNDSKCETKPSSSSSSKPSSSENVIVNPQTGEMAIFIIWVLGFAAAGYSVWYYIKGKKEN